jgi:OOP family OmpA-OmpF porin
MKQALIFILILFAGFSLQAQVKSVQQEAEKQGTRRVNKKIDQGINKGLDKLEDGIGSLFGKKKKKKKKGQEQQTNEVQPAQDQNSTSGNKENIPSTGNARVANKPNVQWSKFDFVPGDEVIFEDGPSTDEENGEFPSRWDLFQGGAEIVEVDGEPVITFITAIGNMHSKGIVPYLKNANEDYLPEVFTIEFDVYFNANIYNERFYLTLHDRKNQNRNKISQLTIFVNQLRMGTSEGDLEGKTRSNRDEIAGWRHISIAYTEGKLKAYSEDQRLINIPHLEGNPTGITLAAGYEGMYLKNIRIAKGGVKYYDRVLSDGKIIVNGIRFDVNKATIKPESNGAINEIYQLMKKQTDLNFSVEGHTDSDGDDTRNQTLSEQRGKAVMERLVSLGISSNRLKSAGWGESKPIGENGTPEGKANNRRVEFVKFEGSANPSIGNSSAGNPAFDKLDRKAIGAALEGKDETDNGVFRSIPISNQAGIINGEGSIIIYATTGGKLGKMEILDVDKNNNYELTVKFVTYNYNGSVYSQSNKMQIEGTYGCDLDEGYSGDVDRSDAEFFLGRQDKSTTRLRQTDETILRVYSN